MKLQCCICKFIFASDEWDGMLDCELAREEEDKKKCCYSNFENFQLEPDEKLVKSYLDEYLRQTSRSKEIIDQYFDVNKFMAKLEEDAKWAHTKELKGK